MKTAWGCLNSLSHWVQLSTMFPSEFKTTRQCSQRPSTPYLPFQSLGSSGGPSGLDAGPWPAFRKGSPLTGKERLRPIRNDLVGSVQVLATFLSRNRCQTGFRFRPSLKRQYPAAKEKNYQDG